MAEKMFSRKKDDITKAIEQIEREEEDKAWKAKKAEYGDRFNAKKFYELSNPWYNLKEAIPLIIVIIIMLWICIPMVVKNIQAHELMLSQLHSHS